MFTKYLKKIKIQAYQLIQKKLFPAPKIYIEGEDNVKIVSESEKNIIWIPSRRQLKHTCIKIPNTLKGKKKDAALRLKILAWSPFKNTEYSTLWKGDTASVYAWDSNIMREVIKNNNLNPENCEVIPETFIRKPLTSGIRLVKSNQGTEGQIWENELLKVSRWWKDKPDELEWSLFTRNSGLLSEKDEIINSNISNPEWFETPWINDKLSLDKSFKLLKNRNILIPLMTLLATPLFFLISQYVTYSIMSHNVQSQLSLIKEDTQKVRNQRRVALNDLSSVEKLLSLNQYPHQIEIISNIHSYLSPLEISLVTWDYSLGNLEFSFSSKGIIDTIPLIKKLEENNLFSNVSTSTRGNRQILKMKITKDQEKFE